MQVAKVVGSRHEIDLVGRPGEGAGGEPEVGVGDVEVAAGGEREKALSDMAARTNVDEVSSFASVILQSIQFGTSVSDALTTYASEMRISRELKAQEMANKLPVKMSGVMAALMLPALFLLILGPIAIRWSTTFS